MRCIFRVAWAVALLLAATMGWSERANAVPDIVIGNVVDMPPDQQSLSSLQAVMSFASFVSLEADNSISVIDAGDISDNIFLGGKTSSALNFIAPVFNLDADLTIGTGDVQVQGTTANLSGRLLGNDGAVVADLAGTRLTGTLTQANVLGAGASIEQAVLMTVLGGTVSVLDGLFADVSIDESVIFDLQGISAVTIADGLLEATALTLQDSAVLTLLGSGFEIDTGSGFLPVGFGALSDLAGTLRGTLASGATFESNFSQGGGGFTGSIVLASVPEPGTALLMGAGLTVLGLRRRSVV